MTISTHAPHIQLQSFFNSPDSSIISRAKFPSFRSLSSSGRKFAYWQSLYLHCIPPADETKASQTYDPDICKRERSFCLGLSPSKMSGYYYPPHAPPDEEEEFDFTQPYPIQGTQPQQAYQNYDGQPIAPILSQRQIYHEPQQLYQPPQQYQQQFGYQLNQAQPWITPTVPSNYPYDPQTLTPFPRYSEPPTVAPEMTASPSRTCAGYLSPDEPERSRARRSTSFASNASSVSQSDVSRSTSPNASEMARWGFRNENGTWSCAYPGCASRSTFNRGCDLRKHYKRHTKSLFCRYEGCPQATEGGFSSKKDRARHEAKHNPNISCEWEGCDRLFSRADNMVSKNDRFLV